MHQARFVHQNTNAQARLTFCVQCLRAATPLVQPILPGQLASIAVWCGPVLRSDVPTAAAAFSHLAWPCAPCPACPLCRLHPADGCDVQAVHAAGRVVALQLHHTRVNNIHNSLNCMHKTAEQDQQHQQEEEVVEGELSRQEEGAWCSLATQTDVGLACRHWVNAACMHPGFTGNGDSNSLHHNSSMEVGRQAPACSRGADARLCCRGQRGH